MKFLDLNGLNHFWTKMKASFCPAIVNTYDYRNDLDNKGRVNIPFVANHQIIRMNLSGYSINVYNWFKNASKGGILEIFFAEGKTSGSTHCSNNNISYMYQIQLSPQGLLLSNINSLATSYNTYARLIKTDDDKLFVAEFVQNK